MRESPPQWHEFNKKQQKYAPIQKTFIATIFKYPCQDCMMTNSVLVYNKHFLQKACLLFLSWKYFIFSKKYEHQD